MNSYTVMGHSLHRYRIWYPPLFRLGLVNCTKNILFRIFALSTIVGTVRNFKDLMYLFP